MSLKEHSAYQQEIKRLQYTIDYIKQCVNSFEKNKNKLKSEIKDAYVELDFLDSSLSYVNIITNSTFLDYLEKNQDDLIRSIKKPYFCRIDFKHDDSDKVNEFYIGKISLPKIEDNELLIVDWRSPISSVYYDSMPGPVTYKSPSGFINGELILKRQYTINNSVLENIMDVDITTTDTFLQAALGENKDSKLKDIVSTIQSEQNDVIRADISYPLIVQGVAGSGKTTIALHRIAYLLYTYEENFDPEHFMIIAPNRLFLNYISEVLPELGVDQVKQITFIDLFYEMTGISFKILNTDQKILDLINLTNKDNFENIKNICKFKGSLDFKVVIDSYVNSVEQNFIPEQDFELEGYTIYTYEEIKKMFLVDFSIFPLYKRSIQLKKTLKSKLKSEKNNILEKIETYYDKKIEHLRNIMPPNEERRQLIIPLMDERDAKLKTIKNKSTSVIKKYLSNFPNISLINYYEDLITNKENFNIVSLNKAFIEQFCSYSSKILNNKKIELEDLAGLLYMQYKIFGFEKKANIKCIVIDEAQDFSLFTIYTLKEVFNTKLFTILGDLAQGIHSYRGITDWNDVLNLVFKGDNSKFLTLEQSYRTTIEIMNLANQILKIRPLKGLVLANPVVRHGDKPTFSNFVSETELLSYLTEKINSLKQLHLHTIAIICKTLDECKKIKKYFSKNKITNIKLLHPEDNTYEAGTVILPAYLSKGLEFDAVIITSISDDYTDNELDLKLLYIGMTRALHKVDILSCGELMKILYRIEDSSCIIKDKTVDLNI